MGFMDFLKKESKDLKFKDNAQESKDSFDSIPPPPKEGSQASMQQGQSTMPNKQSSDQSGTENTPSFPGSQQSTATPGTDQAPAFPENSPNTESGQSTESLFPQSQNATPDHTEFMPPGNDFNEQPKFPEDEPLDDISWDQDPAYTSGKEVLDNTASKNPFEETSDDEDLSLPDLPDIPSSAMSESLGASSDDQETGERTDEQKSFDEVNDAQGDMNQQGFVKAQEQPEPAEETPEEEHPDELPELEAEYLPEDEAIEEEEKEQFVESHQFYETLQDIKAVKRGFKDSDIIMKDWAELDGNIEEQAEKFIETIDTLQEEMIKIDSTLFEEG